MVADLYFVLRFDTQICSWMLQNLVFLVFLYLQITAGYAQC